MTNAEVKLAFSSQKKITRIWQLLMETPEQYH